MTKQEQAVVRPVEQAQRVLSAAKQGTGGAT